MCPDCQKNNIVDHPSQAGLHQCDDCKASLVRLSRENVFSGRQVYYIKAGREGVQVHRPEDMKPRGWSLREKENQ